MTARNARDSLSRRDFIRITGAAGGGLVIGVYLPGCAGGESPVAAGVGPGALNAWIRIGSDDTVTFLISESEMGQGVHTALSMALAEELEVDWEALRVEHAPTDPPRYGSQSTGGSTSIRQDFELMRTAGATAREMLVAAAAVRWDVPPSQCRAERGYVVHTASERRASYGALAEAARHLPPPLRPRLKQPDEFRLIGTPMPRVDAPAKVAGTAIFGIDVQAPDLPVAQIVHPPVFGATVRSVDASRAREVDGVRDVVEVPTGVAVVADHFWAATRGRTVLEIEWDLGPWADLSTERIAQACQDVIESGATARDDGSVPRALDRAATRIEAVYDAPYLAPATMEPMNCTAHVHPERCEIWVGTQSPSSAQQVAAQLTGLPLDRVQVHTAYLGGGFGRRSQTDFVRDAVHISQAVGGPVKVVWTREDDMRAGWYRPVSHHRLEGGLDADGWPIAWVHRIASPGILESSGRWDEPFDPTASDGAANMPYGIENVRVTCAHPELPVPVHWWRAVGHSQNPYVVECFVDELARAGGKDPAELRLRLLEGRPRHGRLLDILADKAGWGRRLPDGQAQGIAINECFGSLVAQVAEVSLENDGAVRVHRVVCAVDCGQVVNPDTVIAQMESGICFGLTAALWGEVTFEDGRPVQGNFDRYRIVRMREMPRIETYLVPSGLDRGGIGETGLPPVAPAVCNALFALTGRPVRSLPIGRIA
jgi:isoquinoline 1-oxidoreductase beta subunit